MRARTPAASGRSADLVKNAGRECARLIVLSGTVQGVGFRPFIYTLAIEHRLSGWVRNRLGRVEIHIQGPAPRLDKFVNDVFAKAPRMAHPLLQSDQRVEPGSFEGFSIRDSIADGESDISVPADLFTCDQCLDELYTEADRRYRYPFINCTQCGPRYTLIRSLPYDRPNTTMAGFKLCGACRSEYQDPADRRFHAEPVACPVCGPTLTFCSDGAGPITGNEAALAAAVQALRAGRVVAVKGIGGYHLMCDACSDKAVAKIRQNKPRPAKPLAVLFPGPVERPFEVMRAHVELSDSARELLAGPARPIVLLPRTAGSTLSDLIAPGLVEIGVMLPYSPLHHLLLNDFSGPLVATSANISGEPVLTDNEAVEKRLAHVAEAYLHHDRPIERPADDPVFRPIAGKLRPLRLGRGVAPAEFLLPFELKVPVVAVGAQMKNAITLAWGNRAVLSPHIGDMGSARSLTVFEKTVDDLQRLYGVRAERLVCDAHAGYTTSRWALRQGLPVSRVYHHHAHASLACYPRLPLDPDKPRLVLTWDGVGFGVDGTLWGGETFLGQPGAWQRVASMRPFHLPGGEKAGREPWRSAAALCWEAGRDYAPPVQSGRLLYEFWRRRQNAPKTSAVGRLFDAAAALTGVCHTASFEGQGPMLFEALSNQPDQYLELTLNKNDNLLITNWEPLLSVMLDSALTVAQRAALFHASLAQAIVQQANALRAAHGVNAVSLTGGVFQNRVLTEHAMSLLQEQGFEVDLPESIPVNDAGISFGQVIEYGFTEG